MSDTLRRRATEVKLGVALVGPGVVGRTLLEQLRIEVPNLHTKFGIDLRVLCITNSRQMVLSGGEDGVDLNSWGERLIEGSVDASLGVLTEHLKSSEVDHCAVIDCTASEFVPKFYSRWMEQGIHVVTPNKRLNSGRYSQYVAVQDLQHTHRVHYLYEGTVGAGLPVISTLKNLLDTGDQIERIEGVFSGSLSYILNDLHPGGKPFSEVVSSAKRKGFTEPDPRDDLSGADVTRKIITLARECGSKAELDDVATESLVPQSLQGSHINAAEFMAQLPEFDTDIDRKVKEAHDSGEVLRYVGSYDAESGVLQAGLRKYPKSHAFAHLSGTENMIAFHTLRYPSPSPLIIRGPGAGPAVTAAGVFGDIVTLCRYLGAAS